MKVISGILLTTAALLGCVSAQVYTPPTSPSAGAQPAGPQAGQNTTIVNQSSPSQGGGQQVLGNELPYLDPTTDVFSFDGKSFNVNDNRIMRARFEKYLNAEAATSEDNENYRAVVRAMLDDLSPHNRSPQKMQAAVAKLQIAAEFPQDGRICESIANNVYRAYQGFRGADQLRAFNEELKLQRSRVDWKFDQWTTRTNVRRERKLSEGPEQEPSLVPSEKAGHLQRYVQDIAEMEAARVANTAKAELTEASVKVEFQALMVQLFMQRRFEHTVIATRLYTEFFKDGEGTLNFNENSEVQKTFTQTIGFDPTVSTLDALANEAIRDVNQQVESFGYLVERGELDGAVRQLQQAFVTGEHLPAVQAVTREDKRKILDYASNSFRLISALEVKDYAAAEQLVATMKEQASDFDSSKPTAAIEGARLSSNMRIRTAKNAALKGDDIAFQENITAAAAIWPGNPALKEQFDLIADSSDAILQAQIEFDRLLGTQSYRQIFSNKARFIAATVDDAERQAALEQVLENIQEIETVMKQADTLGQAGSPHAAWEIVEKTFKKFPDDVPLSAKRSDLATEVAPFVNALTTAGNLEKRKQYGSGLAWYLAARKIYAQSEMANEGIRRLVDVILPEAASEPTLSEVSGGE